MRSGEKEHKGGEPPRAITTASLVIFMVFNVFPRNPKNFVLLSIPSLRSLCSFVLKHRARRHVHGALRTPLPPRATGRCGVLRRRRDARSPGLPARALPPLHPQYSHMWGARQRGTRITRAQRCSQLPEGGRGIAVEKKKNALLSECDWKWWEIVDSDHRPFACQANALTN